MHRTCGLATFSVSRRSCSRRFFFVIRLANREILHVAVTPHPTAEWAAQQIVEGAWDRAPPRFLIHDRDSRYGVNFDRRVGGLGIRQVRTPVRSPRAVAERRVRSARSECFDYLHCFQRSEFASSSIRVCHLLQSLATAPLVGPGNSMRRGKAPPSASMPTDRYGTCAWRVTPHLPRCCMTSFCAPQDFCGTIIATQRELAVWLWLH
jgi:hypothetical protein